MEIKTDSKPKGRISRRDFLKLLAIGGLSAFLGGYSSLMEPGWLEVTELSLKLPRLPQAFDGFRLVQLSDLHLGGWLGVDHLKQVLSQVAQLKPDWVALTGDFVFGTETNEQDFRALEAELTQLATQVPALAVLGNHDYWFGAEQVLALLERSGVKTLMNTVEPVRRGQAELYFGGVASAFMSEDRLEDVLANLPKRACAILLAHEPDFADQSAATERFDLQISGHSHGGQVSLPLIGPPFLPYLGQKYPSGLYRVGKMYQYTNRGLGMVRPYVRFNCRPEITVLTLKSA